MLYDTIEIRPTYEGGWRVSHRELPYDRKSDEQALNSVLGFFHYPKKMGKEKAFETLRSKMIEDRLKAIEELQSQVDELRALTAPRQPRRRDA